MKKILIAGYFLAYGVIASSLGSCKGNSSDKNTTDTTTVLPASPTDNTTTKIPDTAVVISADDSLKTQLIDATKDYPGVSATVDQGVITLTGNITRKKLPDLMKAVNALHPKKVNNKLTIQ